MVGRVRRLAEARSLKAAELWPWEPLLLASAENSRQRAIRTARRRIYIEGEQAPRRARDR
jgi:hypothetical protein